MTTTQLFVEILVIGFGAIIWLGLLAAALFGYSFKIPLANINVAVITPVLSIAYVLGILVDRIAFLLFQRMENNNRQIVFGENPVPTPAERERYVLTYGEHLRSTTLYNRSRLRICRSWVLNFSFMAVALLIWHLAAGHLRCHQFIISIVILLSLSLVAFYVVVKLYRDYYVNIQGTYQFLRETNGFRHDSS